jgi:SNF2 family DNA or RNA helicase
MESPTNINLEIQTIRTSGSSQLSKLREYQWIGVKFLLDRQSALLADEMGLGKTVQTAVAIDALVKLRGGRRILVICPSSLCLNWERELGIWAPDILVRRVVGNADDRKAHFWLPFKVWVASYEQARGDIDLLSREPKYDLVVLDETQRIKNPDTSLALACRQIPRVSAWALSGTPIENKPEDLLSIFAFLKPGLVHSALTISETHQSIAPYFLRRNKKGVLKELPPIIIQDLVLDLEEKQREAYDNEWANGRERIRNSRGAFNAADLLAQITRLKLLCNFEPSSGESCKLSALSTIVESMRENSGKVLVFSQYVDTLKKIQVILSGLPIDIFHGGLSADERSKLVSSFEDSKGPRVLLVSLKAGGVGLNLGSASVVVLFDRWWNPAVEDQAIQRAHRYGRLSPLQVIRFIVSDTIEERIQKILEDKRTIFNEYIEEAETAEVTPFTQHDLIRILGLESFN